MVAAKPFTLVPRTHDAENWGDFIGRVAHRLSEIQAQDDAASWEKARIIIDADAEANMRPEMAGKKLWEVRHRVVKDLRQFWGDEMPHPRPSFISHARKVYDQWPDVFVAGNKKLPYENYRHMATCALPSEQKQELREWAETNQPTRTTLRQRIHERVDAMQGVYRPDFDLKVSNHWVFQCDKRTDGFDGGVNYELYANLVHLYSDPGDTVIDPFAGGGLLGQTLARYRHFREITQAENSGPRHPLMSDVAPSCPDIHQADVLSCLPWDDGIGALAILDPPYWKMSDEKYGGLGKSVEEWMESIRLAIRNTARCLKSEGALAIMTDDFVRKERHEPLGLRLLGILLEEGFEPLATIYNFNRNFIGMSPLEMARAKKSRLQVNAVKIIHVVQVP